MVLSHYSWSMMQVFFAKLLIRYIRIYIMIFELGGAVPLLKIEIRQK